MPDPAPADIADDADDDADDPRLRRLLAAAHRAAGQGYDAVSMRDLAAETRMSLATIYTLVGSKDALIARAHAGGMGHLAADIARRPPRGRTAEARVRAVLHRFVDALDQDEVRTRALMRALYSNEPRVAVGRRASAPSFARIIHTAIGDADVDRDAVTEVLGHVVNSVILLWFSERLDVNEVRARLDRAVSTVLRGA